MPVNHLSEPRLDCQLLEEQICEEKNWSGRGRFEATPSPNPPNPSQAFSARFRSQHIGVLAVRNKDSVKKIIEKKNGRDGQI